MNQVAIIGLGNWGKKLLKAFNKLADVTICCTNGNKENIDWLNKNFPNTKHTTNFDEVVSNKNINAIVIATPINTHYDMAKKALLANKHVFVEKPLSTSITQAQELLKIAKEKNLILFTGNVFLYSDIFAYLEKLNNTSPFKKITWNWNKFGTFEESIFWNLTWHDILMSVKLMGKSINIELTTYDKDAVKIMLDFENNKKSIISVNRLAKNTEKTAIFIAHDKSYSWNNDSLFLFKGTTELEIVLKSTEPSLDTECKTFINLLDNESSKMEDDEIILETIRIVEALTRQSHGK